MASTERWAKRQKRQELQHVLVSQTGCDIQHDGWPCNTCFHALSDDDELWSDDMWHAVLVLRGDCKHGEHGIDMPAAKLRTMVDRLLAMLKPRVQVH